MGEGEPEEDRSTQSVNPWPYWFFSKKGGRGTSLFCYMACRVIGLLGFLG